MARPSPPREGRAGGRTSRSAGPAGRRGELLELRDITFGRGNRLYALEGRRLDTEKKEWVGNCPVQILDAERRHLEGFAIDASDLAAEKDPPRIAIRRAPETARRAGGRV